MPVKINELVIRKDAVRAALEWLVKNNELYKDVQILKERINILPENDQID